MTMKKCSDCTWYDSGRELCFMINGLDVVHPAPHSTTCFAGALIHGNDERNEQIEQLKIELKQTQAERDNAEETWDNERKMYQAACVERDEARGVAVEMAGAIKDRDYCEDYCQCCEHWDFNQGGCVSDSPCYEHGNYTQRHTTQQAAEVVKNWRTK